MEPFKIGINMAGAISAGAYTAGVLDFLIEALDQWYAAKEEWRKDRTKPPVPLHDVSLEVFSGASAGGMCAAIAALQVREEFKHVTAPTLGQTTNRLYRSWVEEIDITHLLKSEDLESGGNVISLLDSTIIDQIAERALAPSAAPPKPRDYISKNLNIFLTLTNLRGVPYRLYSDASDAIEESTAYYGDRIQFEMVQPGNAPESELAKPLPLDSPGDEVWQILCTAAKATGAFPVFLAPRVLTRKANDYLKPMWPTCHNTQASEVLPEWSLKPEGTWETLNVDGGVIDNDPFDLAHDYLFDHHLKKHGRNPREAIKADRAVLTVAPFPAESAFDPHYNPETNSGVFPALSRLFTALISQSRFFGESLALMLKGPVFSRFVIAPSDETETNALQCGTLGAFGGFFSWRFRAHDYLLGRRNCQQFLRNDFVLPEGNPIIKEGLHDLGSQRKSVVEDFHVDPPEEAEPKDQAWIPIIPLVGTARVTVSRPLREFLTDSELGAIVDLIAIRFREVVRAWANPLPSWRLRWFLKAAATITVLFGKNEIRNLLRKQLIAEGAMPDPDKETPKA